MPARFDQARLVAALDARRAGLELSWRQVARQAGLEPSTLQRIVAGSVPDLARFVALVDWLGASADEFIVRADGSRFAVHRALRTSAEGCGLDPVRAAALARLADAVHDLLCPGPGDPPVQSA